MNTAVRALREIVEAHLSRPSILVITPKNRTEGSVEHEVRDVPANQQWLLVEHRLIDQKSLRETNTQGTSKSNLKYYNYYRLL
jgi:hypothetical protein